MEVLKENIEKLNNLYFSLFGLYNGSLERINKAGVTGRDVDHFKSILDVDYLGVYLEVVDDEVIDFIKHSLECDSYVFTEMQEEYKNTPLRELYGKSYKFNNQLAKDVENIREVVNGYNVIFGEFNSFCDEMINVSNSINRSLFFISQIKCKDENDSQSSEKGEE